MPPAYAVPKHLRWWWLAVLLALGVYAVSACWHVRHGALNTDEGFYAITTRSVAQGEMPYRDFGFTQPPVVLYANALPLRLAGFGLFPQRIVNGGWAAVALLIAAVWLGRRTHPAVGAALILLFALTAPWMYFIHLGKTYAITTLLGTIAAWVFLAAEAGPRRNFLLGLLAALGVGSRLPAAPYFGLLWLLALWPGRRPTGQEAVGAIAGVLAGLAVVLVPFALAAPEALWFWTVDFHRLSVPNKPWDVSWREIVVLAPGLWLLALLALAAAVWRRELRHREAGLLLAAGAALAGNLLARGTYEEYGVPFLLPLALAAVALTARVRLRPAWLAAGAVAVIAAHGLVPPLLTGRLLPERRGTLSQWLPPSVPPYQPDLAADLAKAREIVATQLPPTAPFVGSNLILAAETGRFVPAELRMGPFSWTGELPADRAARLHLAIRPQLDAWFADPAITVLAFFQRWDLNYGWSMPSFQPEPPELRTATLDRLERDFRLVFNNGFFFILVRRPQPTPFSHQLEIPAVNSLRP